MKIIDLSHLFSPAMPFWPGTDAPRFTDSYIVERDGFAEKRIEFCTHNGTHVDAPAHILPDGRTLDDIPADRFVGRAAVLDFRRHARPEIDRSDLIPWIEAGSDFDYLLLWTGWSERWGRADYFRDYPALTEPAARWAVDLGLKGLGVDAPSVDGPDSTELPVHRTLLGGGMVIVENLTNLGRVPVRGAVFSCLPWRIADGDGAPVRAAAIIL